MRLLFVIPARGGSKGIPGKNIKLLHGKPLIHYSIEFARLFSSDDNICLSTDSLEIQNVAKEIGLKTPFIRPAQLATDWPIPGKYYNMQQPNMAVQRITMHWYYCSLLLLQKKRALRRGVARIDRRTDMVVSVKESAANPYFNLFEENEEVGLLLVKGTVNTVAGRMHQRFTNTMDLFISSTCWCCKKRDHSKI